MLDEVTIFVRAGRGGNGAMHFRREKFVPHGGPDGGDGGDGGNVLVEASPQLKTLADFHHRERCAAEDGGTGGGREKTGRRGEDLLLSVPVGTVVSRLGRGEEALQQGDLGRPGAGLMLVRGGRGGWGNRRYATATNQEPRLAEAGEEPEEGWVRLELKLVADVGVVGLPNAGKSSLLRAVSAARPKVAGYPFTTLEPELAVVERREDTFIMVEVPGLIEGAHLGVGLGYQFLRHAERTRLLLYLVDGSLPDVERAYAQVREEVAAYSQAMAGRPQVVAVNKVDIPEVRARATEIEATLAGVPGPVFFISAVTGEGVTALLNRLREQLAKLPQGPVSDSGPPPRRRGKPRRPRPGRVVRQGQGRYLVEWPKAERVTALANLDDGLVRAQLLQELRRLGVAQALAAKGARPGDTVRIGKAELEWMG
jgi:GTP-binding protein